MDNTEVRMQSAGRPVKDAAERIAEAAESLQAILEQVRTGGLTIDSTCKTPWGEFTISNRITL